jgi:ribonuclease Z
MEITFLGTTCMIPTKERNHQGIFISYKNEGFLFDCGEGIQRQFRIANIKPTKITKIFLSHWHGDHVLGLPGLLQTMSASEYVGKLLIFGPRGTKKSIKKMMETFKFDNKLDMEVKEINKTVFFDTKEYKLEALKLEHSVLTLGFSFVEKDKRKINVSYVKNLGVPEGQLIGELQNNKKITWKGKKINPKDATYLEKGTKISIINDTLLCNNCYKLAKDADLLISEAVHSTENEHLARRDMHLTAKQAGLVASQSNVKKLILTHFSQRYKNIEDLLNDAKEVFDKVDCAFDFMKIKI